LRNAALKCSLVLRNICLVNDLEANILRIVTICRIGIDPEGASRLDCSFFLLSCDLINIYFGSILKYSG
jgi:hypothetical protein